MLLRHGDGAATVQALHQERVALQFNIKSLRDHGCVTVLLQGGLMSDSVVFFPSDSE